VTYPSQYTQGINGICRAVVSKVIRHNHHNRKHIPVLAKFMLIPGDVQEFLDGYPGVDDDPTCRENFEFYSNNVRCIPDYRTIQEIHERLPAYTPRVMWSLIIFLVDGSVIITDWNTNMDIYSGCRCTLLQGDQGLSTLRVL
jgi:hypothetical protein